MKISNFRNLKRIPSTEFKSVEALVAEVDVTTVSGFLWWKTEKVETRKVYRDELDIHWKWLETGEWTPNYTVEKLYSLYSISKRLEE